MANTLPPELIELIVGFVRGRSTLKSCALVSTDFLYPAQQRLFKEVVISPPKRRIRTTPAQRFLDSLLSSPHIASFVQSLVIECEDSVEEQPWLYHDTSLQHILPRLDRLNRISVNGKIQPDDETAPPKANLSWSALSSNLRSALTSIMSSGSVVDLELGGFSRIPVTSVIQSCSQLKKLSLLPLYLVDDDEKELQQLVPAAAAAFDVSESLRLDDITIKQSSVALRRTTDWLLRVGCGPNIRSLKRFHFTVVNNEDHKSIAKIMDVCSSSLQHLDITPGSEIAFVRHLLRSSSPVGPPSSPLTLANLHELRSLKINTVIQMYKLNNNRYSDPLPWIVSLLHTLPFDNAFEELELNLGVHINKQILESISWMKLVSVLTSDRFEHLKRLTLTFNPIKTKDTGDVSETLPPWIGEVMENNSQLGELRKEGLLAVHI